MSIVVQPGHPMRELEKVARKSVPARGTAHGAQESWGHIRDGALGQEYLELESRYSRDVPFPAFIHAAVIASLAATNGVPWYAWVGWLGLEVLQRLGRYLIYGRLPNMRHVAMTTRLRVVMVSSAVSGTVLGLSLFFFPYFSGVERMIQAVVFIGMCTAAIATTVGYRPVFLAYLVPILGPLTLVWLFGIEFTGPLWQQLLLFLAYLVYVLLMVTNARHTFRVFEESFYIRNEHDRLNKQLSQALAEAEASNRAKTQFLASASHDLRQPIHTLSLFSAALSMRELDNRTRVIADNLDIALESLSAQLDTLLDISKLDAGVITVNSAAMALRPMLERLCKEFQPLAEEKHLALILKCREDFFVQTDAALFERVMRNLLANAIKYTHHGQVEVAVASEGGKRCLSITDTGCGIPDAEIERVFEEFYQLDNPERDRQKGLGLGLAIVKRLANMLDIDMQLQSRQGEGTRFELRVHSAASGDEQVPNVSEPLRLQPVTQKLRALVVDDEAAVRVGMQTLLEGMDYEVHVADSTESAVSQAKNHAPDILFADFRLRGEDDGLTTIRRIRDLYPDTPALLISGDTDPQRLREAHDNGIRLLHKPVRSVEMQAAIAEVLEGEK